MTCGEQILAPTVRPDEIVLLDNLSSHKIAGTPRRSRRKAPNSSTSRPTAPTSAKITVRCRPRRTKTGYFWAIARDDRRGLDSSRPASSTPTRPDAAPRSG
jgi:hypothetical protein